MAPRDPCVAALPPAGWIPGMTDLAIRPLTPDVLPALAALRMFERAGFTVVADRRASATAVSRPIVRRELA
jgi:hypothetical protein